MPNLPQKKVTGADLAVLIFLAAVTLFSGVCFPSRHRSGTKPETFSVTSGGVTTVYPLTEDAAYRIESEGFTLTVSVNAEDRSVAVSDSDCPDSVCRNTGRISRPGQTIVCVPAKTVVRIDDPGARKGGADDADFIVG